MTVDELLSVYEQGEDEPFEIEENRMRYYREKRNWFSDRIVKRFWYEADVDMDDCPIGTLVIEVEANDD